MERLQIAEILGSEIASDAGKALDVCRFGLKIQARAVASIKEVHLVLMDSPSYSTWWLKFACWMALFSVFAV